MTGKWMTYHDAGVYLGISPEAVRMRANRARWPKSPGKHPKDTVKVLVPEVDTADQLHQPCGNGCPLAEPLKLVQEHCAKLENRIRQIESALAGQLVKRPGRAAQKSDPGHQPQMELLPLANFRAPHAGR